MPPQRLHNAYLIVFCDNNDNALVGADVWSSPEWQQSQCRTDVRTFVALHRASHAEYFGGAMRALIHEISNPDHRYHYLYKLLPEVKRREPKIEGKYGSIEIRPLPDSLQKEISQRMTELNLN